MLVLTRKIHISSKIIGYSIFMNFRLNKNEFPNYQILLFMICSSKDPREILNKRQKSWIATWDPQERWLCLCVRQRLVLPRRLSNSKSCATCRGCRRNRWKQTPPRARWEIITKLMDAFLFLCDDDSSASVCCGRSVGRSTRCRPSRPVFLGSMLSV